jgi:hypothetical protein
MLFCLGFLTLLEFYTMRKMKSAERPKKKLFAVFFSFCSNSCWGSRLLLKFCMSNLNVVFHIWCKRLDLFWSVRGLTSKMPTYPTCQLAPVSPNHSIYDLLQAESLFPWLNFVYFGFLFKGA